MSSACVNDPILDTPANRAWHAPRLGDLLRALAAPPLVTHEPEAPVIAYELLFAEVPHLGIQRRVREALRRVATGRRRRAAERGYLYVFRDVRDGDAALVKIGSSVHVRRRMTEWRTALGATEDELALLFYARTVDIRLAEDIVHALLQCQWRPRIDARTGAALVEYFRVESLEALRLLVTAVARYVAWFTTMRHRAAHARSII